MDLRERHLDHPYRHPWETARADSLLKILASYPPHYRYADVGCGDQYFARRLLAYTTQTIDVVDVASLSGNPHERIQVFTQVEALRENEYDGVLLLDVLEHVQNDRALLADAIRRVKPGGMLMITVPAEPWLYSNHDRELRHFRRYRKTDLLALVESQGVTASESFYFFSSLVPWRAVTVWRERWSPERPWSGAGGWLWSDRHVLTRVIHKMLCVDFQLNRMLSRAGLSLIGLSIGVVCQKKSV